MSESDDLMPEFLAETMELVEKLNKDLDGFLSAKNKTELMDSIFRSVHTIKGGCSMFSFTNTQAVSHALESHLSGLKSKIDSIDSNEIQYIRGEIKKIEDLLNSKDKVVDNVENRQPAAESGNSAPSLQPSPTASGDNYIRVSLEKVDETMNGISEVFLIRNQMVYLVERFKSHSLDERDFLQHWDVLDSSLRRSVGELERSTMSMRMMTVQGLFSKVSRIIQAYGSSGKKKIQLNVSGEGTELDKKVLDTLSEPLIHLVRNAMDHGIENPEDRRKNKKPEQGTITLNASISENEAIIKVSDDGKGIDPKKILESATKKGLDVSKVTDDRSAIDLIFLPGFSTAETISDISGRGVGMDAVKTSVSNLGGRVIIDSKVGVGSTFTIRLPVSMSLIPVVLVDIKGLKYAVPLHDILETRQTDLTQIKTNAGKEFVQFRGSFVECADLRSNIQSETRDHEEQIRQCSVIFFKYNEAVIAARVSSFERNTEIIVKPISALSPKISWVSGVSVLPTGEPVFVLSLPKLYETMGALQYAA